MSEYIITDEQIAENRRLHGKKLLVMPVIVRCRDCVYMREQTWNAITATGLWCVEHDILVNADGFCAWGERKDLI